MSDTFGAIYSLLFDNKQKEEIHTRSAHINKHRPSADAISSCMQEADIVSSDIQARNIYETLIPKELRSLERQAGADYVDKMMHKVPQAESIKDREAFIVERCKEKRVLNLGCASGALHGKIKAVAKEVIGIDKDSPADWNCDLDDIRDFPYHLPQVFDVIIMGEILEHLGNPGSLLNALRPLECKMIVTVPNGQSEAVTRWNAEGYEQVNPDHVAWYSWKTLKTLVERYGFKVDEFYWYRGRPMVAEGLIFVVS